jgi:pimeloyl-ACP methyl ester carboxylesterase
MKTRRNPKRTTGKSASSTQTAASSYLRQNADIEQALLTGDLADELTTYFGEAGYAELTELARGAAQRGVKRGAERVLILPGIMGTKLGIADGGLFGLDDVIWLDPKDTALGTLTRLKLGPGSSPKVVPLGAMLLFYLKLKLRLRAAGFDADFWGYDWRDSVKDLGAQLANHIHSLPDKVHLVAHSMGGLIARAALKQGASPRVNRLVMLGTPNHGSFMATQAVRATLDTLRTLATFDPVHTAEELCAQVFNTFPGLYQLLPSPRKFSAFDLFDPTVWPPDGPQPVPVLLHAARGLPDQLAPANDRFHLIAGVNQETITGLELRDRQFIYTQSRAGDGTVPLAFAQLDGASTHYVDESHGSLPNHAQVARAVADLLRTGQTSQLPTTWTVARAAAPRKLDDQQLRTAVSSEKRGRPPVPAEARELLARFVSADARETTGAPVAVAPGEPPTELRFDSLVVGRRRQHRLDICLAQGDITQANARAIVLGLFREVTPTGAARAIDNRMDGAISDMVARRMFAGNVGEVFILPTGRHPVRADLVLFAGLGTFDSFQIDTLQLVAENTIRTLIRTDVEDLATVLLGGNSGQSVAASLEHLLRGFLRGLLDTDRDFRFRRITLCESDPARFAELRQELYRLAGTPLLADVEVTFDERVLPSPEIVEAPVRGVATVSARAPNYLIVRQEGAQGDRLLFRSSILTAGAKATVVTGEKPVSAKALHDLLAEIESDRFTPASLQQYGRRLGRLLLADEVIAVLPTQADRHLVVVHDAPGSRVPWETLHSGGRFPAVTAGMSRRYLADNLSVAKWLEGRRQQPVLEILLVVNPTQDLPGAELEGQRVKKLLGEGLNARLTVRHGTEATRDALRADFRSGKYDLVHYAGHAFFDPAEPSRSGILCAGGQVLSGAELSGLGNLPNLVVFNACEAGRIRGAADRKTRDLDMARRVERAVGLAESFLRGGIANYVGTYWPVGDAAAETFAVVFYQQLLHGESVGAALLKARNQVQSLKPATVDWADYLHYGDFNSTLKQPS